MIIAGGRDFNDYALLKAKCDTILAEKTTTHRIVIVSGAARGADSLGERYAREHGYALDSHPADWNGILTENLPDILEIPIWRTVPMP